MRFLILIILLGSTISSCTYDVSPPQSYGNYSGNVGQIIQANCLGGDCHSSSTSLNTGLDLSSWEAMTKGSVYFNEVIPFNAVKSHFFGHINTNTNLGSVITPTMPLARDPLSESDQLAFFDWIIQGAKSADVKIPYSNATKKIFVINQNEDMYSVIDAQTQRLIRILSVGTKYIPKAIALMPDLKTFVVAMAGANGTIRKYGTDTYGMLGEFESNVNPSEIALASDGTKGYVTDDSYMGNRFGIFDPIAMKLTKTMSSPLIIDPLSVAVSPDGMFAYISGGGSDNILRIDTRNDSVLGCTALGADVPVPVTSTYQRKYGARKIVISADSKTMYVSCLNTNEIVVLDLMKDSITSRIPILYGPWGAGLTPDGSELWVTAYGANKINVVNTVTNQVIAEIDSISQNPRAITITPDGAFAFVACELASGGVHHHGTGGLPPSSYVVIDCKTRKVISIQELPALSVGIAVGYK